MTDKKKKKRREKAKDSGDEAEPLVNKDGDQFELVDQEEVSPQ